MLVYSYITVVCLPSVFRQWFGVKKGSWPTKSGNRGFLGMTIWTQHNAW